MSGQRNANYEDRLGGYVEVKERVRMFYDVHPDGRLVTTEVRATTEPDGVPRVWVEAAAYRTADDPLPGRGWSWMTLPGGTPYTRGSEIENTETSAWGRAIGSLGIGIDKSIASANEVRAKGGDDGETQPPPPPAGETAATPESGLIGVVEVRAEWLADLALRVSEHGPMLGFRLKQGRQSMKVQVQGDLAEDVYRLGNIAGASVTCWGTLVGQEFTPKGATRPVAYQVLRLERIRGPWGDLPHTGTTASAGAGPEPSTDLTEAESAAIWSELDRVGA